MDPRRTGGERGRRRRTYLEAVDGEEAAEDALLEPRPQHDDVVLDVHGGDRRRRSDRPVGGERSVEREGEQPERSRKMWISNGSSGGYWGRSGRKGDEAVVRASSLTRSHPGGRSYLPSGPPRPTQNRAAHEFVHAKPNQQKQQQGAFSSQ